MSVRAFADVTIGEQLPGREVHVVRKDLVRYAGASGDFNVIHWDEHAAAEVGLPDVIAHGMLTMGQALQLVVDWLGDPGRIVEYGVRFTRPVAVAHDAGALLALSGKVLSLDDEARRATVELTVAMDGQTVLGRARATVQLA
jgi:acyl dehydratase